MSDNLTTPVASGAVLATDDVAGVQYPRVKISFGVDGAAADVTTTNRFPVDVGTSIAVTQSGTWNVTNISGTISLPTGAATSALQTTGNTSLSSIDTKVTGLATAAAQTTAQTSLTALAASAAAVEPFSTGGTVTPSDSTVLTGARGVWVGGAGNVTVTIGGVDVLFSAVPAGTLLPVKATKVKSTGTTATLMAWLG